MMSAKFFCPVCDEVCASERSVYEHLLDVHKINLEAEQQKQRSMDGSGEDGWVLVNDQMDKEAPAVIVDDGNIEDRDVGPDGFPEGPSEKVTSSILSPHDWTTFWSSIPQRLRFRTPVRTFCSEKGFSWSLYLRALRHAGPVMSVMRTLGGERFGFFLARGLPRYPGILGCDREALLMRFGEGGCAFGWQEGNADYVSMWWEEKGVVVGCDREGRFALQLDPSLETAVVDECSVFNSPALSRENAPRLAVIEVFKI